MGFRFRKSLKIAPGVKLNIGKKGITSVSIGKRGASVNINKKGTRSNIGIPGTGISHTSYTPHKKQNPENQLNQNEISKPNKILGYAISDWIIGFVILLIVGWLLI